MASNSLLFNSIQSVAIILGILIGSCRSYGPADRSETGINDFIHDQEELSGTTFQVAYNMDSTYCILEPKQRKGQTVSGNLVNRILIVRVAGLEVMLDENIRGGSAKWESNNLVEIFYPGEVPGIDDRKIFNVDTGKTYSIKDNV